MNDERRNQPRRTMKGECAVREESDNKLLWCKKQMPTQISDLNNAMDKNDDQKRTLKSQLVVGNTSPMTA